MGALMGDVSPSQNAATDSDGRSAQLPVPTTNGTRSSMENKSEQIDGVHEDRPNGDSAKVQAPEDPHKEKLEKLKSRVTITKDGP